MAIEILLKKQSNEMIAYLLNWATGKSLVETRFEDDDDDQWSVITLYDYKGDKELSLRLHYNDVYNLHLGYYVHAPDKLTTLRRLNV